MKVHLSVVETKQGAQTVFTGTIRKEDTPIAPSPAGPSSVSTNNSTNSSEVRKTQPTPIFFKNSFIS